STQRRVVTSQEESVCVGEFESSRAHQEEHVLVEIEEEEEEEEEEQVVIQIPMAQTIRALSNPVEGGAAPLCNGLTTEIELKSGFLHHLPKFHGL
ncbi:MAG: hypothetical protein K6253_03115, partial [Candidatus Liberibacter asiaticus]|nr:hypothetical protein [Candidatus Liberibacter asiaticus]